MEEGKIDRNVYKQKTSKKKYIYNIYTVITQAYYRENVESQNDFTRLLG